MTNLGSLLDMHAWIGYHGNLQGMGLHTQAWDRVSICPYSTLNPHELLNIMCDLQENHGRSTHMKFQMLSVTSHFCLVGSKSKGQIGGDSNRQQQYPSMESYQTYHIIDVSYLYGWPDVPQKATAQTESTGSRPNSCSGKLRSSLNFSVMDLEWSWTVFIHVVFL